MRTKRSRRFSGPLAAVQIALLVAAWVLFAPTRAGGQAVYVVVSGNSMEPLYQRGDLVILRRVAQPQVGDVVAYNYPQLGTIIHRIIARDGDTYVFKGDNNSWLDGYQPVLDELIGKAWIHIPQMGTTAVWLRQPLVLAFFAATMGGVMMVTATSKQKRRKSKPQRRPLTRWWELIGTRREGTLLVLSLLFFASGILAFFAFTNPVKHDESSDIAYHHSADFSYVAAANSEVYDRSTVQTGEPIFPRLTCKVHFTIDYALASDRPVDLSGSYRVLAQVSERNGWKRTLELQPETPFSGSRFSAQGELDLCQAVAMIGRLEELTGLQRTDYMVSILLPIDLQGSLGGQPLQDSITPRLDLGLDDSELYVLRDPTSSQDPLHWTRDNLLPETLRKNASLPILGLDLPVWLARLLAVLGLVVSIGGFVGIGVPLYRPGSENDIRSLRFRYGTLFVRVEDGAAPRKASAASVTDLASMDDLVRLAEQTGLPVFEQAAGDEYHFSVVLEEQTYRYVVRQAPAEVGPADQDAPPS